MKNNKKTVITSLIVAGVLVIVGVAGFGIFNALNAPETAPAPVETVEPVEATEPSEVPSPAPTEEPQDGTVDDRADYIEAYTEWVSFADHGSMTLTVGDVTKDCSTELPPFEGDTFAGFSVEYLDEEHTKPVAISCGWNTSSEDLDALFEGVEE